MRLVIEKKWSDKERSKRKKNCSNPKGFTMKQFCKNQKTKSKKGERKNESYLSDEELLEIIEEEIEEFLDEKKKKKRKKAGSESSKESSLRDWFKRKGAKGKKGGWVDCNAPDGKGGYKSCGRSSGEKRSKYPACRPTPSACKERGRGKSWGKKAKKGKK